MKAISSIIPRLCQLALSALLALPAAHARPDAKIELIEPFGLTFESEAPVMFVRITNTGTESLDFATDDNSDLQFENEPALAGDSPAVAPWSRRFSYVEHQAKPSEGRSIKPGASVVLSQLDYSDMDFSMYPWEFRRIRPHFRVQTGEWVAGDWYERKMTANPDLAKAKSLYEYKLGDKGPPHSVIALPVAGETWLMSCRLPSSYDPPSKIGQVERRLCRLPSDKMPTEFTHDVKTRRLTIRFGGGEEDVVINTRSGMPVSGSERTVPHLHLWKKLSGRPFTDAYQEMLDNNARKKAAAQGQPAPSQTAPTGEAIPGLKPWWLWLVAGTLLLGGGIAGALRWRRRAASTP